MEAVEPGAEVEPPSRAQARRCDQHEWSDDFDVWHAVVVEEPLHHLAVEEGERELLILAAHVEAAIEVVVLELHVVMPEMIAEPGHEVLVGEAQGRARGGDGQDCTREAVVLA